MTNDLERFSQGLQDLIYIREKLSSELADELKRSESLATAVAGLRRLNDASQTIIEDTLYRIGVWKDEDEAPDHETAQVANRFAHRPDDIKRVVNDSFNWAN